MKYQETGTRHDHRDQNSLSGHHQDHPRGRHRCLPVDHPVGTRVDHLGIRREIQQCFTFGTLAETRAKQAELRDAKKRGVLVKRDNITFDELCERWLDSRHDIREVSRLGYTHLLKAPRAQFGAEKVQDLCRADIENLIGVLERRKRSHRTITYTRGTISQVLDYGIASGLLSVNVAAGVKVPRKQHSQARVDTTPKIEPWTYEELLQFRTVADLHEWAACWRLTLCGLRRSEVMGMTWDAINLVNGEATVKAGRVAGRRETHGHRRP
jgi:integrase